MAGYKILKPQEPGSDVPIMSCRTEKEQCEDFDAPS